VSARDSSSTGSVAVVTNIPRPYIDDLGELASAVDMLAREDELRARVGLAGKQHVRSKYTLDNMHASHRRLHEAALTECGHAD
jgi:hypothetical protein